MCTYSYIHFICIYKLYIIIYLHIHTHTHEHIHTRSLSTATSSQKFISCQHVAAHLCRSRFCFHCFPLACTLSFFPCNTPYTATRLQHTIHCNTPATHHSACVHFLFLSLGYSTARFGGRGRDRRGAVAAKFSGKYV